MAETKEKKVKIKLPLLRGEKNQSVYVGAGNRDYLIQRGVEVEVPEIVAEILRLSDNAEILEQEFINGNAK